ncbi:MAG: PLxRFG domain-containing protein, partial [Rhodospirillales bacterium]
NKAYADHRNSNAEDSWIAFYPTQIKSAIGNNGSFNAKNPDIAFSRTGTLKDFIEGGDFKKKTTDAVGALFQSQRTFGAWHKTVGTQYHKAQVDADFRPVYESGQAYLRDMATIANNAADLAPDLLPKLQDSVRAALTKGAVSKADEQAVSNAVFKGTLDDTVYTSAADAGLTPEQFAFYKQARAAIDNSLDALVTSEAARLARKERGVFMAISAAKSRNDAMIIADFLNQEADLEPDPIAAKRKQALADSIIAKVDRINDLKQKGYAPLTRFGTHTVYVVENGIQRSFTLHESQVEANRTAKAMQELYPQAKVTQGILSEEAAKLFQGISPDTLELFGDVATVGPDGQEVFLGQTQVFQEYLKNAVNNRSALKRLIQRKGIEGYSKDVTRVLATFITSNARASSGNYHLGDMLEATNDIPKEKGDVKDEAVKLLQYVQNPVEEAAALRSFLFVQYLGGSVASAFVNMTQPLLQTFPYLSQWGPGKSAAELTKALGMVGKGAKITDERLAAALARAEKDGVVSPQEIHQLYAESARTFGNNRAIRRVLTVWGSLFGLAEQFNRRVTFIAAWNMAKDFTPADFQKAGVRSAFQFAEKAVDETQGIYNRGNRPDWARGALGATLFTFKQFSISYLELLKRLPNRERAIALGILVLAAGLQGLPGADDLDDVIDALMQSLGYSWNSKQEKQKALANILGRDGANFVMNGFSALPGVPLDVQGRLGLGNLIPGTAALKKSEVNKGRDVIEILGPAGGLVQDVVQGAGKLVTGDIGGAAQEFVPVSIRNAIKSVDMLQFGMYRDEKGRKVLDTDAYDAFIKGVGFQPRDVADASRTIRRVNQDVALVKVVESEIAEKMAQGYFEKDQQKILDARAQLMNWNQTNPGTRIRITPAQVQRRVREMNMTREQRIVKTAPKEIRADVKAQLQ